MIAPAVLHIVKSGLKSFYDIEPLVVDHLLTTVSLQAKWLATTCMHWVAPASSFAAEGYAIETLQQATT